MAYQKSISSKFSIKQLVVVALLFMMFGTITELFLLHHYEGVQQLIPIICIGIALIVMAILFFVKNMLLIRAFQMLMVISALSGVYGTFLHLQANFEFEQEMKPTATVGYLVLESLSGALPALAPGSMVVFALIGTIYIKLLKQNQ